MRSLPRGWQAAVLYAVSFAQAGAYVSLPASSAVLYGFGLSKTAYGSLFLPMILMAALAAATGPRLARRCGLRWLYRASHLGNVCMLAVLWNSPSIDPRYLAIFLAGGSLVLGLSLGWMGVVANATISSLYPRRRSIALSGLHATLGVGATLTPALYGVLIASGHWSVGPQIFGATSGLFLIGSILAPSALAFPDEEPGRRGGVMGRSALRGHALRAGLYGVAESTVASWAVLYLVETRGLGADVGATALSSFWLALTCGRVAAVFVLRHGSSKLLMRGALVAQSLSFFGIAAAQDPRSGILAYLFAGLAAAPVFPIVISEATEEFADELPRASAWTTVGLMLGLGLGSFSVGPLSRFVPITWIFSASCVWPLLLWWAHRRNPPARHVAVETGGETRVLAAVDRFDRVIEAAEPSAEPELP